MEALIKKKLFAGCAFWAFATFWAFAVDSAAPGLRAADLSSDDRTFIKESAEGSMTQVALAELALKNSSRPDIQMFARQMVADHKKATSDLMAIVKTKGTAMPQALSARNDELKTRLAKLSGPDFDADYIKTMVDEHRAEVSVFGNESQLSNDPDLKKFASQNLPIVKEHLVMIKAIQGKGAAATQ